MAFLPYKDVIVRAEGYKAHGSFINSNNFRQVVDKEGAITFKLKVTKKCMNKSLINLFFI